ncbi:hypothetical protein NECAME_14817 [Necator americanus]|uniref:Coiled-coil domain-containing protein 86 n=1 Tax=Necator americanus TaxID=51031 RepID=W2SL75_NECAM|nr:hypothetical protein NECAME_14817 [Necator americanus]ETN70360.1 hypothetical protein NECAME_14817 [Necator americanus]
MQKRKHYFQEITEDIRAFRSKRSIGSESFSLGQIQSHRSTRGNSSTPARIEDIVQICVHSAVIKVKPLKSSWEKKMADRAKQKQVKLIQQEIRDRKEQEKQEKIERRKEQEKRRLENEKKGEVVQVIKNTAKLRKAKKKQLRFIEKRDTN